jgi:predicted amidophosphoribosyltransferase
MAYVSPLRQGLQCGECDKKFMFCGSKKTSWWRTDAIFECPKCFTKLEYPSAFRLSGQAIRFIPTIAALICIIKYNEYLSDVHEFLVLIMLFGVTVIFIKSFGLKNKHVLMVKHSA